MSLQKTHAIDDLYDALEEAGIAPDRLAASTSPHWLPVFQPGDVYAGDAVINIIRRMLNRKMTQEQLEDLARLIRWVAKCAKHEA